MTNSVYLERIFDCTIEELFLWFSRPKLIAQWFGPQHLNVGKVTLNFSIGGTYRIELKKGNGSSFYINGTYKEIEEPNKVVFDLTYDGLKTPPPGSIVKIRFDQVTPHRTKLSFVQKFDVIPPDFEKRTKAWEFMFDKLKKILANFKG